ncbi:MAG: STAS domain-containing protein [Myxococcales bacterium]
MDSEGPRSEELSVGWEQGGCETKVSLRGIVDGATARALCERLAEIGTRCRDRIVLDLSGVQEISEFGAALLSHGLRSRPALLEKLSLASASRPTRLRLGRFGVGSRDEPPG